MKHDILAWVIVILAALVLIALAYNLGVWLETRGL